MKRQIFGWFGVGFILLLFFALFAAIGFLATNKNNYEQNQIVKQYNLKR
jgi:hypothetical protein